MPRNLDKPDTGWPIPNIWLGVSVENQATATERLPILCDTPVAIRFLSIEPLLAPVNIEFWLDRFDWVIVGGESGANARPMNIEWVRAIRDQCAGYGVPFFFKQGSQANWRDFRNFERFPEDMKVRDYPK